MIDNSNFVENWEKPINTTEIPNLEFIVENEIIMNSEQNKTVFANKLF